MPGAGGTQRLTKLVGRTKALEWIWTGERIPAEDGLAYGIINTNCCTRIINGRNDEIC